MATTFARRRISSPAFCLKLAEQLNNYSCMVFLPHCSMGRPANTMQLLLVMMVMLPPLVALCVWFCRRFGLFVYHGARGVTICTGAMYADSGSTVQSRLLLPSLFPLIVYSFVAVKATSRLFGDPMGQIGSWLTFLGLLMDLLDFVRACIWEDCGI